ncbi:MAG: regulatory protein RecX [Gammaproteobacteria bacterium]|nr:regulatory protein RecX [Gammaproteobacteria bacterium]
MRGVDERRAIIRDAAVRLLARREHSRLELARKLGSRGHPDDLIEETVADLADDGLQSDDRFAQAFVRSALGRGQGPLRIRAGLAERGINSDIASTYFDLDADEWRERAASALYKRFGSAPVESRADWARRARFLAGRGFPSDVAAKVLGSLDRVP